MGKLLTLITLALLLASCEKETITKETIIEQPKEEVKTYHVSITYTRFVREYDLKVSDTIEVNEGRNNKQVPIIINCNGKTLNDTVSYTWHFTLNSDLTIKVIK